MNAQMTERTPFVVRIMRKAVAAAEGTDFSLPIRTALSSAGGERPEMADTPAPDNVVNKFAAFNYITHQRTIRLSGEVASSGGAVAEPLNKEVEGAIDAIRLYRERSFFLPSTNVLATMSVKTQHTSSTVLEIDSSQYLFDNMKLDILVSADGLVSNGVVGARLTKISENNDGTADITILPGVADYTNNGGVGVFYALYNTRHRNKGGWGMQDTVYNAAPSVSEFGVIVWSTASTC